MDLNYYYTVTTYNCESGDLSLPHLAGPFRSEAERSEVIKTAMLARRDPDLEITVIGLFSSINVAIEDAYEVNMADYVDKPITEEAQLRDLAERLRKIPVEYGTDDGDIALLEKLAGRLRVADDDIATPIGSMSCDGPHG